MIILIRLEIAGMICAVIVHRINQYAKQKTLNGAWAGILCGIIQDYNNSLLTMEIRFMILYKTIICILGKKPKKPKAIFFLSSFSVF